MKLKKIGVCLFSTVLLFAIVSHVRADATISVKVNNKPIEFTTNPIIKEKRTLVPLRGVFEAMGFTVSWIPESRMAVLTNQSSITITATPDSKNISVNGTNVPIDVAPEIVNGSMMLPVRAIAESTSARVDWNKDTRTVSIYYKNLEDTGLKADTSDNSSDTQTIEPEDDTQSLNVSDTVKYISEINELLSELDFEVQNSGMTVLCEVMNIFSSQDSEKTSESVTSILNSLDSLKVPNLLDDVQTDLKAVTSVIKEIINIENSGKVTDDNFDEYCSDYTDKYNEVRNTLDEHLSQFSYMLENANNNK